MEYSIEDRARNWNIKYKIIDTKNDKLTKLSERISLKLNKLIDKIRLIEDKKEKKIGR